MSETTQENFSAEEESKANKNLMILSAVLMVVFLAMGFMEVASQLTHYLWFFFAAASFGGVFVFWLVSRKELEVKS